MKRILVTGATGRVGRQVVAQLLEAGAPVRAMSRRPEAAGLPAEVEVVRGDFSNTAELDECLDGVETVFLLWTAAADAAPSAIERIASRARRVTFLSSPHQTPHPFFQQPNPMAAMHAEIERLIEASGLRWTYLRPGMFAANALFWWAPQIRGGNVVRWVYADAPTAPVHEADIAAVAVRALLDDGHEGTDYVLTGPESLTQREQVSIIGDVIGRQLRFEEMTPDEARRELAFPPPVLDMLFNAWQAALGQPALVISKIAEITRRPPRRFCEWVIDNAAEFGTTKHEN